MTNDLFHFCIWHAKIIIQQQIVPAIICDIIVHIMNNNVTIMT